MAEQHPVDRFSINKNVLMGNRMRAPARARARIPIPSLGNCLGDPVPLSLYRQQLQVYAYWLLSIAQGAPFGGDLSR